MKRYSGLHNRLCTIENNETTYCLKLDIKKFYPSIPHD